MRILIALVPMVLLLSSCRKCKEYGFFIAPMYVRMSPVPQAMTNFDTINFMVDVPFNANDVRDVNFRIPYSLEGYKPFELPLGLSGQLSTQTIDGPRIEPFKEGILKLNILKGEKKIGTEFSFDFQRGDTSWQVHLQFIPLKRFEGLFSIRFFSTGYRDRCLEIGLQQTMINTPQSHHLVDERLTLRYIPHPNDIFFYVE